MKNSKPESLRSELCLHEFFERQAEKTPRATALIHDRGQTTFEELNSSANKLARCLRNLGIGPETLVGFCLERTPDAIVALLAILKAGAGYVPLDPGYPAGRLKEIADDSNPHTIITTAALRHSVPSSDAHILCVDQIGPDLEKESSSNFDSGVTPGNVACVLYTSGSTGKPKGVVKIHRGHLFNFPWADYAAGEVWALNFSLGVGYSSPMLFLPLLHGIPVALIPDVVVKDPESFVAALESSGVTHAAFVPSSLKQILSTGATASRRLASLRAVVVGGAQFSSDLAASFAAILPRARLFNHYASSETGLVAYGELTDSRGAAKSSLALRVAPDTQIRILNENGLPAGPGETGELYIAGPWLARGYLNEPELTSQRFVQVSGERACRTGDLGRYLPTGEIEILGRVDNQVKIKGFRVELEEIEAVLERHESLREAAVAAQGPEGEKHLAAWIVLKKEATVSVAELREHVRGSLPEYMTPATFFILESLPLTPSGKKDRAALPSVSGDRAVLSSPYRPPASPTEVMIAGLWASLLDVPQVGTLDTFIELGGDSLRATRAAVRIKDQLGVEAPLALIFDLTVGELSEQLDAAVQSSAEDTAGQSLSARAAV